MSLTLSPQSLTPGNGGFFTYRTTRDCHAPEEQFFVGGLRTGTRSTAAADAARNRPGRHEHDAADAVSSHVHKCFPRLTPAPRYSLYSSIIDTLITHTQLLYEMFDYVGTHDLDETVSVQQDDPLHCAIAINSAIATRTSLVPHSDKLSF